MSHIYHYCAQYKIENSPVSLIDGVIKCNKIAQSMSDYDLLKSVLREEMIVPKYCNLIITSLSYLGEG